MQTDTSIEASGSQPIRVEEIVRRDLETRTLAVVDALYDLAARAADGQPSSVLGVGESVYVVLLTQKSCH